MIIDDVSRGSRLRHVGLGLTADEAQELKDALTVLLEERGIRHEHVPSADYQTEITVWIQCDDEMGRGK